VVQGKAGRAAPLYFASWFTGGDTVSSYFVYGSMGAAGALMILWLTGDGIEIPFALALLFALWAVYFAIKEREVTP
jgi:hypothetical protein